MPDYTQSQGARGSENSPERKFEICPEYREYDQ